MISKSFSHPVWRWLRDIGLILALVFVVNWWQTRGVPRGESPVFEARLIDGSTASRPQLLHFWATWCHVCRLEESGIDALAKDFRVVTVAVLSGNAVDLAEYQRQRALSFPVVVDETGELAERWGVQAFPTTIILDREGRIDTVLAGYSSEWGLRLRLWWKELAGDSPPPTDQ